MTVEAADIRAAADRYIAAYNAGTTDFVDTNVTEDFRAAHFPGGEVLLEGREAFREGAAGLLQAVPDRRIAVRERFVVGDWVAQRMAVTGTVAASLDGLPTEALANFPPPGEAFTFEAMVVWQIRDGRVAVEHIYSE